MCYTAVFFIIILKVISPFNAMHVQGGTGTYTRYVVACTFHCFLCHAATLYITVRCAIADVVGRCVHCKQREEDRRYRIQRYAELLQ